MPNYEEMWTILETFNFRINKESLINTSCIICHSLLINAYQGPCGCNYCKNCIDNYLNNENFCPSQSNECIIENVDFKMSITKDNSANKRVSKLSVKCPSDDCDYMCPLIEMNTHLRVCNHVLKPCPFLELGCTPLKMNKDQIAEHMLYEICPHSRMMIESMKHTKNEILSNISNQVIPVPLPNLENMIDLKLIDFVKTFQNHQLSDQNKFSKLKFEFDETKKELEKFEKKINEITKDFETDISVLKEENISLNEKRKIMKEEKEKCERPKHSSFQEISNQSDLTRMSSFESVSSSKIEIGYLKWSVKVNGNAIASESPWGTLSEKFYSPQQRYEMRLRMWIGGCQGSHKQSHICVEFTITTKDISDKVLLQTNWPITCSVSMTFRSVDEENDKKITEKRTLTFKEPDNFDLFSPWSSQFHFPISDLMKHSLITNNSILVQCYVYIN